MNKKLLDKIKKLEKKINSNIAKIKAEVKSAKEEAETGPNWQDLDKIILIDKKGLASVGLNPAIYEWELSSPGNVTITINFNMPKNNPCPLCNSEPMKGRVCPFCSR